MIFTPINSLIIAHCIVTAHTLSPAQYDLLHRKTTSSQSILILSSIVVERVVNYATDSEDLL